MTAKPLAKATNLAAEVTALQRHASDPAWSIWVGASAGSGKTKVLADRVTRLLLAGVSPQRLLCLTFTRAAAAEMSIRLMQRLAGWATCDEEKLDKDLVSLEGDPFDPALREGARRLFARTLACPGGMRIQTIHAFAQEVLRRFPLEAGVSPHFALIEEAEVKALKEEAVNEVLEQAAEGQDAKLSAALTCVVRIMAEENLRSVLSELMDQSTKLRRALTAKGGMTGLIVAIRETLELGPGEDEEFFRNLVTQEKQVEAEKLKRAAGLLVEEGTDSFKKRGRVILDWLAMDPAQRQKHLSCYIKAFLTDKNEPYSSLANKKILEDRPDIGETLAAEAIRLRHFLEREEAVKTAAETEALLRLGVQAIEAYDVRKATLAALDYDDLIEKTLAVLSRPGIAPWVLYKLDGGLDHILVDEAQDTNTGQWQVVKTLVEEFCSGETARSDRNRTLFVVGDEKQSIFSFQGADPEAFFTMRERFAREFQAAQKKFDEVPLTVSFRSAPAVLRAVDAVFAVKTAREGVAHGAVMHQAFRAHGAGRVEVWPLLVPETGGQKGQLKEAIDWSLPAGYESVQNPAAELERTLAARIGQWLAEGQTIFDRDLKIDRPITPGDVMILVRTRGDFVNHLVRELKAHQLPVAGIDRMILTQQLAIMDLIALLQFTLLPQDDLTLATVLRGPLIGASEDDLMALAIGRENSLWERLSHNVPPIPNVPSSLEERKNNWLLYLRKIAAMADGMTPLTMLIRILSKPCPADPQSGRRALLRRLGPDAEDPIDELLSEAEAYGERHTPSLQGFLQALLAAETQVKRELEQAMGRIRITTVHASKGLEAPIVILPDTVGRPNKKMMSKILWTDGTPVYLPRTPFGARLSALREAFYETQMEEYRRLLYVALTRAADRLIVCGFQTNQDQLSESCWYHLIAQGLRPHHQPEVLEKDEAEIVLADFAVPSVSTAPATPAPTPVKAGPPAWLFTPPAAEPLPPRPLTPSRPSEPEPSSLSPRDPRFARGRILHRLLQNLPDIAPERREEAARRFLANPQHLLDEKEQRVLAKEVLALVADPRFAPLFDAQSRAEVPLIGLHENRLISGQVDRLALVGDEVWIVDYKTNRPPPTQVEHVPAVYVAQMEAYRATVQEIYPDQKVRCFLLWTMTLHLMEILPRG